MLWHIQYFIAYLTLFVFLASCQCLADSNKGLRNFTWKPDALPKWGHLSAKTKIDPKLLWTKVLILMHAANGTNIALCFHTCDCMEWIVMPSISDVLQHPIHLFWICPYFPFILALKTTVTHRSKSSSPSSTLSGCIAWTSWRSTLQIQSFRGKQLHGKTHLPWIGKGHLQSRKDKKSTFSLLPWHQIHW